MFLEQRACHRTLSLARYTGDVGRLRGRTVAENRSSQKEAGCFHASQGKLIHQATFLWQQMKREKKKTTKPAILCLSRSHTFLGAQLSNVPHFTSTPEQAGREQSGTEKGNAASSLSSLIHQSPLLVCSCWSLGSSHC